MINNILLKKIISIILIISFIILLLPTLFVAQYNHPSADDYSYGRSTKHIFEKGGSLADIFKYSAAVSAWSYNHWQGTLSGCFLMTLGPYSFNIQYYDITTFIFLFFLILGSLFLSYKILVSLLKLDKYSWLIIAIVMLIVSIELVPHPQHSFFWFNGSMLYTFIYSLSLFYFGLLISLTQCRKSKLWMIYLLILPLAFIIGAGNFVTGFISTIITAVFFTYQLIKKDSKFLRTLPVIVVILVSLLIMCLAPGNMTRVNLHSDGLSRPSAIIAILRSFVRGFEYIFSSQKYVSQKAVSFIMLLACIHFYTKVITSPRYKYQYPLIAIILSFCIFCSQFTPILYTFNNLYPKRIANINYFSFIWYILFNIIYISGYLYNRFKKKQPNFFNSFAPLKKDFLVGFYTILVIVLVSSLSTINIHDDVQLPLSLQAVKIIRNGTAEQYDKEYQSRLVVLESEEQNIVFEPYSVHPPLLFNTDMVDNPEGYPNMHIADFFNKESVIVTK